MSNLIHVGSVYLTKDEEGKINGVEIGFTENVTNQSGACFVLDSVRGGLNSSAWIGQTISRVENKDAQADENATEGGDTDAKSIEGEAETKPDAE